VGGRQYDVGEGTCLIRHVREADHERHLADRVGQLEAGRERERGVHARAEHEHLDLAARHGAGERRHF
jgi:hypothetical protein